MHPQSIVHSMVEFRDGVDHRPARAVGHAGGDRLRAQLARAPAAAGARGSTSRRSGGSTSPRPIRSASRRCGSRGEVLALGGLAGRGVQRGEGGRRSTPFYCRAIGFLDMAVLVEHVLEKLGPEAAAQRPRLRSRGGDGARRRGPAHGRALGRGLQRKVTAMDTIASIPLIGGFVSTVLPFVRGARHRRLRARVRPLHRRALVRHPLGGVLDRLRAGALVAARPARHALAGGGAAARRLRPVPRRQRRRRAAPTPRRSSG